MHIMNISDRSSRNMTDGCDEGFSIGCKRWYSPRCWRIIPWFFSDSCSISSRSIIHCFVSEMMPSTVIWSSLDKFTSEDIFGGQLGIGPIKDPQVEQGVGSHASMSFMLSKPVGA